MRSTTAAGGTRAPASVGRSFRAMAAMLAAASMCAIAAPARAAAPACSATPGDQLGPFYRPNAPVRSKVGTGHVLRGTVRSSADCSPLPGAHIELWLAGPNGYDDEHRATVIADPEGRYVFESNLPRRVESRPPHIHVRVEHPGYRTLVTQQYPTDGRAEESFDLVLTPVRTEAPRPQ
jgi:protocatechuate 3,4-dioxygenase beta subunit